MAGFAKGRLVGLNAIVDQTIAIFVGLPANAIVDRTIAILATSSSLEPASEESDGYCCREDQNRRAHLDARSLPRKSTERSS